MAVVDGFAGAGFGGKCACGIAIIVVIKIGRAHV